MKEKYLLKKGNQYLFECSGIRARWTDYDRARFVNPEEPWVIGLLERKGIELVKVNVCECRNILRKDHNASVVGCFALSSHEYVLWCDKCFKCYPIVETTNTKLALA